MLTPADEKFRHCPEWFNLGDFFMLIYTMSTKITLKNYTYWIVIVY